MNGVDHISKTSKTYNEKTTIWIMFNIPNWNTNKKNKSIIIAITTLNQNEHQLNLLSINMD
jgi:hypothetical protein